KNFKFIRIKFNLLFLVVVIVFIIKQKGLEFPGKRGLGFWWRTRTEQNQIKTKPKNEAKQ
ncbi:hypothetical protein QR98_0104370, partial [Sarcoptes scabiei]